MDAPATETARPDGIQAAVQRREPNAERARGGSPVIKGRNTDEANEHAAFPGVLPATDGIHAHDTQADDAASPQAAYPATRESEDSELGRCGSEPATSQPSNTVKEGICVVDVPADGAAPDTFGGVLMSELREMMAPATSSDGSFADVSVVTDSQPRCSHGFLAAMADSGRVLRVQLPGAAGGGSDGAAVRADAAAPAGDPAEASPLCAVVTPDGGGVHPITVASSDAGDEGGPASHSTDCTPVDAHEGCAAGSSAPCGGVRLNRKDHAVPTARLPTLNSLCARLWDTRGVCVPPLQ